MVRFSSIVLTYFVLGVMMWGAGLADAGALGVVDIFFQVSETGAQPESGTGGLLEGMGASLEDPDTLVFGPVLAVFQAISGFVGALFWPVVVLNNVGAPTEVVLLLGGVPVAAFFFGFVRIVRTSV